MTRLPDHEERRLRSVASDDDHLADLRRRRAEGAPLQYLEGSAAFGPFDLVVDERVLIPRPETEGLWELAAGLVDRPDLIVDLGTGSGALAIALAGTFPDAVVIGTDASEHALSVARCNGMVHAPHVEWRLGDLFEALDPDLRGRVDLLVSNPPYIAAEEWDTLPDEVKAEPREALVAGATGLEVLSRIAATVSEWMAPSGAGAIEIGETQGDDARRLFEPVAGTVDVLTDLTGRDRYVVWGV